MLIKLTITQLLMDLFEKFFRLHDPQTPSIRKISLFDTSQKACIKWFNDHEFYIMIITCPTRWKQKQLLYILFFWPKPANVIVEIMLTVYIHYLIMFPFVLSIFYSI